MGNDLFDKVLKDHINLIRHIAMAYEKDPSLVEDLVQDILLAVWNSLERLDDAANLKAYVSRIAQNRAVTHVSREVRRKRFSLQDLPFTRPPTPEDHLVGAGRERLLRYCLEKLSGPLMRVATLALAGLDRGDIAQSGFGSRNRHRRKRADGVLGSGVI